jgi:hypothetical protein
MARRVYGLFLLLLPFAFMFGSGSARPAGKSAVAPRRPDPALVDRLDNIVQQRFAVLTEDDLRNGILGARRMVDIFEVHSLRVGDDRGASLPLMRLSQSGWRTALFVAENRSGIRSHGERGISGPISAEGDVWERPAVMRPLEIVVTRVAAERRSVRGEIGEVALEGRPIPASSTECLKCHRGKRLGDPIGVVIYAFAPKTGAAP